MNGRHTYVMYTHTYIHTYVRVCIHNALLYCMCVHSALTYFLPTQLDSRLRICVGSKKKLHFFHYDKRNRTMLPSPVRMLLSCTHACTRTHTHTQTLIHMRTHTHKHSYTHARTHTHAHTQTLIHTRAHTHTRTHTHTHTHTHRHTYIHTLAHEYSTYTHTHTLRRTQRRVDPRPSPYTTDSLTKRHPVYPLGNQCLREAKKVPRVRPQYM